MKLIDFLKFCSEHQCYKCSFDDELAGCTQIFNVERVLEKEIDNSRTYTTAIMKVLNEEV